MSEDAFSRGEIEGALLDEPTGYWVTVKSIRFPDLLLIDETDREEAARVTQRWGAIKVWWNNGPQHHVAVYAHSVTASSAETEQFHLRLKLMNQGGGIEKVETIADRVGCRDVNRRSVWTFGITAEQSEHITRGTAELFGPASWKKCA